MNALVLLFIATVWLRKFPLYQSFSLKAMNCYLCPPTYCVYPFLPLPMQAQTINSTITFFLDKRV